MSVSSGTALPASVPKLYYSPQSCGAASFIAQHIGGLNLPTEEVSLANHKTASGTDFFHINPKGNVPALIFSNPNFLLNEGPAVLQWIADQNPASGLIPAVGTLQRYELINVFNFIGTDLHAAGYAHLFNPTYDDAARKIIHGSLAKRFQSAHTHAHTATPPLRDTHSTPASLCSLQRICELVQATH